MKKIILTTLALVAVISAQAQGRINFSSAGAGVAAKFVTTGLNGDPLGIASITSANTTIRADLFWSLGNTTVGVLASSLGNQQGYNQAFSAVVSQAGFFSGGTKTVAGWVTGPIVAQIRVWDTAFGGADFNASKVAPGSHWAESALFVITPTFSPTAAPNMLLGTVTYAVNYNPVPEPSSMALAGIGAASLLIFRRRNK